MFGIGTQELLIILVILLLLFGGKKLPGLMKSMGESIKVFKEAMTTDDKPKQKDSKKSN